jgi:hypothetical protein
LEDLVIGENVILKYILKQQGGRLLNGFIWLSTGTRNRLQHGNEPPDSIKHSAFLNKMCDHKLVEKDFDSWSY